MNDQHRPRGGWSQPTPRAEMIVEIKSLDSAARVQRFSIQHGEHGHIDDEVVVTLMLDAWTAGQELDSNAHAAELLRRVTKQVRAHVLKNPGWQRLGGGAETAIDDFCQGIVLSILQDETVPCHAEVAFGNYVYRRCLDEAGKLYAKKHSAGKSLDNGVDDLEAGAQESDSADLLAVTNTPEEALIEFEALLADQHVLERIRHIVQVDLPELPKIAFTFRYFGSMKIESKNEAKITITRLMGKNEKTVTKYINQAIEIIKQGLSNE